MRNIVKREAGFATVPIARRGGKKSCRVSIQGILLAVVCLCQSLGL